MIRFSQEKVLLLHQLIIQETGGSPELRDINLLNQCREDLEGIVDEICFSYNLKKPRM